MATEPKKPQTVTKKHLAKKQKEEKQVKTAITVTIVILAVVAVLLGYVLVDRYIVKPNIVVARVGETEVKVSEFRSSTIYSRLNMLNQANQYVQYFGESGKQYALGLLNQIMDPEIVGENVLNQLIDEVLIREEAAKRNITVSDAEVQQEMQNQFYFFPEGTYTPTVTATPVYTPTWSATQFALIDPTDTPEPSPTPTETPEGWMPTATDLPEGAPTEVPATATLAPTEGPEPTATSIPTEPPTPTPYTERLYKKDVKEYMDSLSPLGVSKSDIEWIIYNSLLREKLSADMTKDLKPVEEQVWVRHILVDSEEVANEVIAKLDSGQKWHDLAVEYSTDTSNKDNGGDLGWIGREDNYDPDFLTAAFALNTDGEISKPVKTQFGWHIIQLVTKATNNVTSSKFAQIKQNYFNNWLTDLRASRDDIKIEDVWKQYAPEVPAVPTDLYNYVISTSTPTGN
ncbi:MAG: peptidylprolyl isomerase [Anaerolineaceae bacterium]